MYRALKDKVLLSLYKNHKCNFVKCIPPKAKGDLNLISKTHCMIAIIMKSFYSMKIKG